jgi:hypothetical protein
LNRELLPIFKSNKNFREIFILLIKLVHLNKNQTKEFKSPKKIGLNMIKYINYLDDIDLVEYILNSYPDLNEDLIVEIFVTFLNFIHAKYGNNLIYLNLEEIFSKTMKIYKKIIQILDHNIFIYWYNYSRKYLDFTLIENIKQIKQIHYLDLDNLHTSNPEIGYIISDKYINVYTPGNPNHTYLKNNPDTIKYISSKYTSLFNISEIIKFNQNSLKDLKISGYPDYDLESAFSTIENIPHLENLYLKDFQLQISDFNRINFPKTFKRIFSIDKKLNPILDIKFDIPSLKAIGGIIINSNQIKNKFFKFLSEHGQINCLANIHYNISSTNLFEFIQNFSFLDLKVFQLTVELKKNKYITSSELDKIFDLCYKNFSRLKNFKLSIKNNNLVKFKIDSVINLLGVENLPFDLILRTLKNNKKIIFYYIRVSELFHFNKFIEFLVDKKEYETLKRIKGLTKKSSNKENVIIDFPLRLFFLSLRNSRELSFFRYGQEQEVDRVKVKTLRLENVPSVEEINNISLSDLIFLKINFLNKKERLEKLIEYLTFMLDNFEKFYRLLSFDLNLHEGINKKDELQEYIEKLKQKFFRVIENENSYRFKNH